MELDYNDYHDNHTDNYLDDINSGLIRCSEYQTPIHPMKIFEAAFSAIVGLVAVIGNSLVIYVVVRFAKMRTATNIYIVNVAITNVCLLIALTFNQASALMNHTWIFGAISCKVHQMLISSHYFTTTIFLLIMSTDCYMAICYPISSSKFRTPLISCIVSMVAWLCSIILSYPLFIADELRLYSCFDAIKMEKITMAYCILSFEPNSTQLISSLFAFEMYNFVLSYAIPLSLIFVVYRLVSKRLRIGGAQNESNAMIRSFRNVIRLVFSLVTLYFCCGTPVHILKLLYITGVYDPVYNWQSDFYKTLIMLVECLAIANLAMNPILCAFLNDSFKKSFLKVCSCMAVKEGSRRDSTLNEDECEHMVNIGSIKELNSADNAPDSTMDD